MKFYSTPCAQQIWLSLHFMLPFLSVILLRQRGGRRQHMHIGPQTYLQIVLTVYLKKEKEKTERNSFILRLVHWHAAKTAAAAVIHMCRASIHFFC